MRATVVQNDGKIIIGGDFTTVNGVARKGIARLNADGSLDSGFNPGAGVNTNGKIYALGLQADGRIVIGGDFTTFDNFPFNRIAFSSCA